MSHGTQLELEIGLSGITQVALKKRARLQQLYDEQFACQRALENIEINFDSTLKHVTVPKDRGIEYFEAMEKLKDIRDEINRTLSASRAT